MSNSSPNSKLQPSKKNTYGSLYESNCMLFTKKSNHSSLSTREYGYEGVDDIDMGITTSANSNYHSNYHYNNAPGTLKSKIKRIFYEIITTLYKDPNKKPEEMIFLFKLDFFLLSSSTLGYFIKYLNQGNLNISYLNGLKEEFHMDGSELNYLQTLWTIGYIIGQVPSNMLLIHYKIPPNLYFGGLEVIWSLLTLVSIFIEDIKWFYLIRFLVGLTESGFFPGMEYLVGSWYSQNELTKRSSLFACAGTLGTLCTGIIITGVLKVIGDVENDNDNGSNTGLGGLSTWKWLFLFDFLISLPIALYTIAVNPNTPATSKAWYFTEREKEIAIERRKKIGADCEDWVDEDSNTIPLTWAKIKSFGNTWHIWVFPLLFLCYNNSGAIHGQPTFISWLKITLGYKPTEYNLYPISTTALSIVVATICATISDANNGTTWPFLIVYFILVGFASICLSIWDIPNWLHWASYYISAAPGTMGQPMIFCWVNRLLFDNDEKRSFVVSITNCLAYVTNSWVPILTWNARDMPEYHIGFVYTGFLCFLGLGFVCVAQLFTLRDEQNSRRSKGLATRIEY